MCPYYQTESQNIKNKGECILSESNRTAVSFNNHADCLANGKYWLEHASWNVSVPECLPFSQIDVDTPYFDWTVPSVASNQTCVLRVRFNVSLSGDIDFWNLDSNSTTTFKTRPYIDYGYSVPMGMAIVPRSLSRTFQDRTYIFNVKARPDNVPSDATIWNLSVKGKRGLPVDVFPSVDYSFTPSNLQLNVKSYIHIQWTGSDYNPNRTPSNGEGGPSDPMDSFSYRADRHNMVEIASLSHSFPLPLAATKMFRNQFGAIDTDFLNKLALINQNASICPSELTLMLRNNNDSGRVGLDNGNCGKLNAASNPYFDGGLVQVHNAGTFYYMSTRSNNPGVKSQKGQIRVIQQTLCFEKNVTDSTVCSGHGACIATNLCNCTYGYTGNMCSSITCHGVAASAQPCSNHGVCTGIDVCNCTYGYTGSMCSDISCYGVGASAQPCSNHGVCTGIDVCNCTYGYTGNVCNELTCYGVGASAQPCSNHGVCASIDICSCSNGYTGKDCSLRIPDPVSCFGVFATSPFVCNSRGYCVKQDMCQCTHFYTGTNCTEAPVTCFGIVSTNGQQVCNGTGVCVKQDTCACYNGFTGANCSTTVNSLIKPIDNSPSTLNPVAIAAIALGSIAALVFFVIVLIFAVYAIRRQVVQTKAASINDSYHKFEK